jgi:hypothetical protein
MATLTVAASGEKNRRARYGHRAANLPSLVVIIYIASIAVIPDSGDLLMPCTCAITGLLSGE